MDKKPLGKPDTLVAWMESLSDATRLRLLRLLEHQELGVVELCDVLQSPQSTVSRHLKVLLDQRWVRAARRATTNYYRMILEELQVPAQRLWLVAREQTDGWATARQDQLRLERVLHQRQQDARTFFAGAAGQWDQLRCELYGRHFGIEAMLALLPAHYVIADLGCGTAALAVQLAGHVKRVIGVDLSPEMLKGAKKRIGALKNIELRKGDLTSVPISTGGCDAVLCLLALTYVEDVQLAVREMGRIVKPGGQAVIVDLMPHDRDDFRRSMGQKSAGLDERQLTNMLSCAGFDEIQIKPLSPEPSAKGPALFLARAIRTGQALEQAR
ncbi:MAG: metalloregulator ArsR/SmtB family transcription factor [Phycisphaerales bacterium]|nr:metalloregulator ArsR/SmtB family transcription factor [Phycisphaerales bacterium]